MFRIIDNIGSFLLGLAAVIGALGIAGMFLGFAALIFKDVLS